MTDIFIIADLFLAHSHTCCCLSKRNWRPLSLCGLTYSSSSHVAVCMCGFAIAVLFVVSRYYIRSWFFPQSLCFSPCVVSQPARGMCFLFACICTGVKTSQLQLQGVGVNSFCNTGFPLRPIVLLWEGVVCIGQSVLSPTQTALSSQSTDGWVRKQRGEGRQCQECTARWHFRSKPYLEIHFLCFTLRVLQIVHASTLLHFSVHLSQIEQRLFL